MRSTASARLCGLGGRRPPTWRSRPTPAYAQLRTDGWAAGDDLPTCGGPRSRVQRQHDALRSALQALLGSGALGLRDKVAPHLGVTVGLEALHDSPGDSGVTRFVLGLGGRVLEMSHTERTLKAHERRAKHVETGGRCQAREMHHGKVLLLRDGRWVDENGWRDAPARG